MRWNIAIHSKMVTTRFGKFAVRVDGSADMAPVLLCQRFSGTMEDWGSDGFVGFIRAFARAAGQTSDSVRSLKVEHAKDHN